jgi:hypothetical protein
MAERAAEPPRQPQRDAIIFIPGLSSVPHRRLAHVTEVLRNEFDRAAETAQARFVLAPTADESGDAIQGALTISRVDGDARTPIVDLYGVDHETLQGADLQAANPLVRVFGLALTVLAGVLIWVAAVARSLFGNRPKSLPQMLQLLLGLGILFLLGAYLATAVVALVQLVLTAYAQTTGGAEPEVTWPQALVVVVAVLGALLPNARELLAASAEQYLRMMRYLWFSGPRDTLRGEVLSLLERVGERPEVRDIHLVAFSFGSLVAVDTLFPPSKPPAPRLAKVRTLMTIGCPFDLVCMLQPAYFQGRFALDAGLRWINVYDPIDLLGSDFHDSRRKSATHGVGIPGAIEERRPDDNLAWNGNQRLTVVTALLLASLRVHAQYWGPNPRADTALGYVATQLFPEALR